jgi:hypothetical protein
MKRRLRFFDISSLFRTVKKTLIYNVTQSVQRFYEAHWQDDREGYLSNGVSTHAIPEYSSYCTTGQLNWSMQCHNNSDYYNIDRFTNRPINCAPVSCLSYSGKSARGGSYYTKSERRGINNSEGGGSPRLYNWFISDYTGSICY